MDTPWNAIKSALKHDDEDMITRFLLLFSQVSTNDNKVDKCSGYKAFCVILFAFSTNLEPCESITLENHVSIGTRDA